MRCLNYEEMDCRTGPVLADLNSKVLQHKISMILISNFRGSHDLLKGQKCIAVDSKNIFVFVFHQLTMKNEMVILIKNISWCFHQEKLKCSDCKIWNPNECRSECLKYNGKLDQDTCQCCFCSMIAFS